MVEIIPLANCHKGLRVGCLNVRSLYNVFDLVKTTFQHSEFHVLGFSETWLNQNIDSSLVAMENYVLHRQDRKFVNVNNEIKKGGGICLYVDKNIKTKSIHLNDANVSSCNIECQWIELCLEKQRNIVIGNLYRPPNGDPDEFIEYLENSIEGFNLDNKDLIICGDVNIDVLDKTNESTKKLIEFLSQTGLTNLIKTPTRFSNNKNSCIDHIYSNSYSIIDSGVLDVNISDHEFVYMVRKKLKSVHTKSEFTGRSYVNYIPDEFKRLLDIASWDTFYNNTDPNILWDFFKKEIITAADILCPQKIFKIKKLKESWLSNDLLESIKDKDRALKKAKRTKLVDDWKLARNLQDSKSEI